MPDDPTPQPAPSPAPAPVPTPAKPWLGAVLASIALLVPKSPRLAVVLASIAVGFHAWPYGVSVVKAIPTVVHFGAPCPEPDPTPQPQPNPQPPPTPQPAPQPALVLVAKEYDRTFAASFADVAMRIKSGELKDKASVVAAMGQHVAPLADTLEATYGKYSTPSGAISDPAGLADVFAQVAAAVGGN